ncbi:hypothetical protein [Parasediminibacterium sp. JCM 36343]|uniref:hypothetical protein n=1 Tax=Parasediminibacterium sp. JCM 36343 TaxID=3374279 RepID=UPI00397C29F9
MSDLKFVINVAELKAFLEEVGGDQSFAMEIGFNSSTGVIVPTLHGYIVDAEAQPEKTAAAQTMLGKTISACPWPPGCS